jgi:hypothetical protein
VVQILLVGMVLDLVAAVVVAQVVRVLHEEL